MSQSSHIYSLGRSFLLLGSRPTQEDRVLLWEGYLPSPSSSFLAVYAVFDGHNGRTTADVCRTHFLSLLLSHASFRTSSPDIASALRATIARLEALALSATHAAHSFDGSTLVAAVLFRGALTVAHVGDSRAVLARRASPVSRTLTTDHTLKSSSERARVAAAGGVTKRTRLVGVRKDLELTRALGDREFKDAGGKALIAEPDLSVHRIVADDAMLLVASDGLWDLPFLDADTVAGMALQGGEVKRTAEAIVREAIRFGSRDNVALVLVRLHAGRAEVEAGGPEREGSAVGDVSTGGRPRLPSGFKTAYWEGSRTTRGGNGGKGVLRSVSSFLNRRKTKLEKQRGAG